MSGQESGAVTGWIAVAAYVTLCAILYGLT